MVGGEEEEVVVDPNGLHACVAAAAAVHGF